jgi:hypothetical protein
MAGGIEVDVLALQREGLLSEDIEVIVAVTALRNDRDMLRDRVDRALAEIDTFGVATDPIVADTFCTIEKILKGE